MSWLNQLLSFFLKKSEKKLPSESEATLPQIRSIPIVKFDSSLVTEAVKLDLRKNMEMLPELNSISSLENLHSKVLASIQRGRDLHALCKALVEAGIPKTGVEEIARRLANKATSLINRDRQKSLGITKAIWMYANAPCMVNPSKPTKEDLRRDEAHRKANGKRYNIEKGMYLNGKWTWPGYEDGCKCSGRSVLPF